MPDGTAKKKRKRKIRLRCPECGGAMKVGNTKEPIDCEGGVFVRKRHLICQKCGAMGANSLEKIIFFRVKATGSPDIQK